jgi:hypothetical protein
LTADSRRRGIRGQSDPRVNLFDPSCVGGLVAPERKHQLRHAVSERAQNCSQTTVSDHRGTAGRESIVVAKGHDPYVVGSLDDVRVDAWPESQESVELEVGDGLDDAGVGMAMAMTAVWPPTNPGPLDLSWQAESAK